MVVMLLIARIVNRVKNKGNSNCLGGHPALRTATLPHLQSWPHLQSTIAEMNVLPAPSGAEISGQVCLRGCHTKPVLPLGRCQPDQANATVTTGTRRKIPISTINAALGVFNLALCA